MYAGEERVADYFFLERVGFIDTKLLQPSPNRVPLEENKITYKTTTGASSALRHHQPSLPQARPPPSPVMKKIQNSVVQTRNVSYKFHFHRK